MCPALTVVPIDTLRLVVGGPLLVFGLGWLRKAILRASGFNSLHDEDAIYDRQRRAAEQVGVHDGPRVIGDAYAFTLAFKGVLLDGLEVAFIVLTFGANQHNTPLAAVVLVTAVGVAARAPLARVPENTLKFAVGVLLTSFGTFWGVGGAGAHWPGSDLALVAVIVAVLAFRSGRRGRAQTRGPGHPPGRGRRSDPGVSPATRLVSGLRSFALFWWDYIVGDDWRIADGVVLALAGTAVIATSVRPGVVAGTARGRRPAGGVAVARHRASASRWR